MRGNVSADGERSNKIKARLPKDSNTQKAIERSRVCHELWLLGYLGVWVFALAPAIFIGGRSARWLTLRVLRPRTNLSVGGSLLFAIALWGGNNTGTKLLVASWPPTLTGGTRFLCAGLLLLGILCWTNWLGVHHPPVPELKERFAV